MEFFGVDIWILKHYENPLSKNKFEIISFADAKLIKMEKIVL